MKPEKKWQDWTNLVLGLWVLSAPWILQQPTEGVAIWNFWIIGAVVTAVALLGLFAFQVWEEWVNAGLGVWLLASPWLLGFSSITVATWNAVIFGALIALLACWALVPFAGADKPSS